MVWYCTYLLLELALLPSQLSDLVLVLSYLLGVVFELAVVRILGTGPLKHGYFTIWATLS
jgi:hypothetical protein